MQVYLALYAVKDNTRYFLLGFKKEYYNEKSKRKGIKLHGAKKFCFPGGKLEGGEIICSGAIREFKEETGCTLENVVKSFTPVSPDENKIYSVVFAETSYENLENINSKACYNLSSPDRESKGIHNELQYVKIFPENEARAEFQTGGNDTDWFLIAMNSFFEINTLSKS